MHVLLVAAVLQFEGIAVEAAPEPALERSAQLDAFDPAPTSTELGSNEVTPVPLIPAVTEGTASTSEASAGVLGPPSEAIRRPADEPAAMRDFAEFVDHRLLVVELEQQGMSLRQRERVVRLSDDDFADLFALVPEAQALALKAQKAYRIGAALQVGGVAVSLGGMTTMVVGTLFFNPLSLSVGIVGGGLAALAGSLLLAIAQPFMLEAAKAFTSAVATYNRGLLDLRPSGSSQAAPVVVP